MHAWNGPNIRSQWGERTLLGLAKETKETKEREWLTRR